jgi:hypothetical protein
VAGDTLAVIAMRAAHESLSVGGLQIENGIGDPNALTIGQLVDICPGNLINDVTGGTREPFAPPPPPPPVDPVIAAVQAQQDKLNQLFYGLGMPALTVDGNSGRFTEQALCAARLALGLPASRADMVPGSPEEQALMSATSLPIPPSAPTLAPRWVLIDKTCQVMFVGEHDSRLVFAFQTSTGEPGYETRDQHASRVFRFTPARGNNGWHNSFDYPVPGDNPLNGNMYLPLYFDGGQAIHGANNVPTSPHSKGCARLRVENQDRLVDWLGIRGIEQTVWNDPDRFNLWVRVQGAYY